MIESEQIVVPGREFLVVRGEHDDVVAAERLPDRRFACRRGRPLHVVVCEDTDFVALGILKPESLVGVRLGSAVAGLSNALLKCNDCVFSI